MIMMGFHPVYNINTSTNIQSIIRASHMVIQKQWYPILSSKLFYAPVIEDNNFMCSSIIAGLLFTCKPLEDINTHSIQSRRLMYSMYKPSEISMG